MTDADLALELVTAMINAPELYFDIGADDGRQHDVCIDGLLHITPDQAALLRRLTNNVNA